jgi:hypothetical protein
MKILYSVIFAFLLLACAQYDYPVLSTIEIDSRDKEKFTDLFGEYRLIFPETNDHSLIGVTVNKIVKYQNKLFLLNVTRKGNNIICFDTTGHYLFTIDKLGSGPAEYTSLKDIFIEKDDGHLILDVVGNSFGFSEYMYFDLDGNYLFSKKASDLYGTTRQMQDFNDSLYVAYCNCFQDSCAEIVYFNKKDMTVNNQIPCTNRYISTRIPSISLFSLNGKTMFYGGNDTIYELTLEEKIPVYEVNFGAHQKEYVKKCYGTGHEDVLRMHREGFQRNELRTASKILCNGKYVSISYHEHKNSPKGNAYKFNTLFLDTRNNRQYNTSTMTFDVFNSVKNDKIAIIGSDEGYFYALLNEPFTSDEIQKMVKSNYLPEDTKQALLKLNDDSNPPIFIFR